MDLRSPGPTIGVVGGGQLGRMLGAAAAPLGVELVVLDPTPDCPAASVVTDQIVGDFDDAGAIHRLAERVDLVTIEIELADADALEATAVPVHPTPATLRQIQDKLDQKRRLAEAGIPVPAFRAVNSATDLQAALDANDSVMLKARRGGYDGRGNVPVRSPEEIADAMATIDGPAMAESFVDFERELSVIGVKGQDETALFPVTETVHREEILRETVTPARVPPAVRDRARAVATAVLNLIDGRGVFGIELFHSDTDGILVNEIAPRPHNSGHWTIEGAPHSQFEHHLRAVLGWPLGATTLRTPTVMVNLLGDVAAPQPAQLSRLGDVLETPGAHYHWYGKAEARPLRKLGHVTVTRSEREDPDRESLLETGRRLRDSVTFSPP